MSAEAEDITPAMSEEELNIFKEELNKIRECQSEKVDWDAKRCQKFLFNLCKTKELTDEKSILDILNKVFGKRKQKGKDVIHTPSCVYEIDEDTGEMATNMACKFGNVAMLKVLLDTFKVYPARKNQRGDTSLHSTILGLKSELSTKEDALECVKLIVKNNRDLDTLNCNDKTAFCLALESGEHDIAKELAKGGAYVQEKLRDRKDVQEMKSELETKSFSSCPHLTFLDKISNYMKDRKYSVLEKKFREFQIKTLNDGSDGYDKSLKMKINELIVSALHEKMFEAVKSLLDWGADIYFTKEKITTELPLYKAVKLQLFDGVEALLQHQNGRPNVDVPTKRKIHAEALHLALRTGQKYIVEEILKYDVNLLETNDQDYTLISLMTAHQLRKYFDHRVIRSEDTDDITIDFNCLLLKEKEYRKSLNTEMDVLNEIACLKKHRSVLNHPLIRCFLYVKMDRVYWMFYLNFVFYLFFTVSFTCFVVPDDHHWIPIVVHSIFTTIFTILLFFREVFQFFLQPKKYFNQLENLLEIFIILSSTGVLMIYFFNILVAWQKLLASFGILLSYIELMLMIGRHPRLTTYIMIFFRVSLSALFFTIWYGPLLIAFSFIFFIFLHDNNESFQSIWNTLFNSFVMLTGELEADSNWSVKNETNCGKSAIADDIVFSRIFLIFFIFFIVIVLVNLLNALAVNDTNAVKEDAENLSYISRIKFLHHVEVSLSRKWFKKLEWSKELLNHIQILTIPHCTQNEATKECKKTDDAEMQKLANNGCNENITNDDETIFKRIKVNRVSGQAVVELPRETKQKSWFKKVWNHLKFLPPLQEILDDSLDMLFRNSKDSVRDQNFFKDVDNILKNNEKDSCMLRHVERKVDSLQSEMKNMEQKLEKILEKLNKM